MTEDMHRNHRPVPRTIRVEGLGEALHGLQHELDLISHASKYDWINKRLIVLRNAVIACGVLAAIFILLALCYHEAYRQTLNIAEFDVPEKLAERGITGKVVARTLFDELIRRRRTVATLDAGDVKEGWTEHASEVAIPETHFTLQAVFRYLRELTGNELNVDGEMLVDGDDVVIRARVAGNPPREVHGKLAEWDTLLGELANYVYDTTQPAVLASYLGVTARTPDEVAALSRYVVKMANANPRLPRTVMSIAYNAYGGALMRQDQLPAALAAFNQAIHYDPESGLAVMNAAEVNFRLGNVHDASRQYAQAGHMAIGEEAKREALRRRFSGAMNSGDCSASEAAFRAAHALSRYDEQWERWMEARLLLDCEYKQAKAFEIVRNIATLHPDSSNAWVYFSLIAGERGERYLREAADGARRAIDTATDPHGLLVYFAHINLASYLARLGDIEGAMAMHARAREIVKTDRPDLRNTLAEIRYYAGDYATAERIMRSLIATEEGRRADAYRILASSLVKTGRTGEALDILRAGEKMFPSDCDTYRQAGQLLAAEKRVDEAITEFEKGIAAIRKCGQPYLAEARLLLTLNRVAQARGKLQALLAAAPESDGADEARAVLASLAGTSPARP
jgi:tetratricopeptide (TPR) repeat protein